MSVPQSNQSNLGLDWNVIGPCGLDSADHQGPSQIPNLGIKKTGNGDFPVAFQFCAKLSSVTLALYNVLFPYIATSYMTIICFSFATNPFGDVSTAGGVVHGTEL